jgi:hypothetical protein
MSRAVLFYARCWLHLRKTFLAALPVLCLFLVSCSSRLKSVEFINSSPISVIMNVRGLSLYQTSKGPSDFEGQIPPQGSRRFSVVGSGPVYITYPVTVSWKSLESEASGTASFLSVDGIPEGVTKLKKEGTFVIGLDSDLEVQIFFIEEEVIKTSKHYRILNGEEPLPSTEGIGSQNIRQ